VALTIFVVEVICIITLLFNIPGLVASHTGNRLSDNPVDDLRGLWPGQAMDEEYAAREPDRFPGHSKLWKGETVFSAAKDRLRHLVGDLRKTLSSIGMADIPVRRSGRLAILRNGLDCDLYRMIDGDEVTR